MQKEGASISRNYLGIVPLKNLPAFHPYSAKAFLPRPDIVSIVRTFLSPPRQDSKEPRARAEAPAGSAPPGAKRPGRCKDVELSLITRCTVDFPAPRSHAHTCARRAAELLCRSFAKSGTTPGRRWNRDRNRRLAPRHIDCRARRATNAALYSLARIARGTRTGCCAAAPEAF